MTQETFDMSMNFIVCAANKYACGTVVLGVRHHDKIMNETIRNLKKHPEIPAIQGFVDKFSTFHNRQEAFKIAYNAGQIMRRCGGDEKDGGTLFSENLY